MPSDELKLTNLQITVDQAVLDPRRWVDVCDRLADFIGGVGTVIMPDATEHQVPGVVSVSPALEGLVATIFRDGWIGRNYRRRSIPIIRDRGFATDHDIADERTLRTDPFYADLMASHGLGVFVGIQVLTTSHTFIAAVERPASASPPDDDLFRRVQLARPILSGGARASLAVGALRLESWKQLEGDASRALFVLDHLGRVIDRNAASEGLLGSEVDLVQHRLHLRNARDDLLLARLIAAACADRTGPLPPPVFTEVQGRGRLMLEAVKLPDTLRYFHTLAAALLIARPVEGKVNDVGALLRTTAALTPAEVKVALAMFEGQSLSDYAQSAGLSTGTARQQIKSVYRKTGTGRQNELSALIRRLFDSMSN